MSNCPLCGRHFAGKKALKQHERDSPVHKKSFHCQNCNRSFSSDKRLENHRRCCQAAFGLPLGSVDTPLYQGYNEDVSSNASSKSPTTDPQSLLLEQFTRMSVSNVPSTTTTHSNTAQADFLIPIHETREFFMFPKLHPNVVEAVSTEISSTWFNEDDEDDNFDHQRFTHVMGDFKCNNKTCKKKFWNSRKVAIEIKGYNYNGYNAVVYNQRCKSCNWLATFTLDERSYIERVAYRLKRWADVDVEAPISNRIKRLPHEQEYCEGCKRGKCQEEDRFERY